MQVASKSHSVDHQRCGAATPNLLAGHPSVSLVPDGQGKTVQVASAGSPHLAGALYPALGHNTSRSPTL